ncbi:MAG: heavy-metal-associated domain-containing protein [Betaproteobacteria bacterium]
METVTMNVGGMSCGGCVANVTRVLKAVPGVDQVDVTLRPGQATVRYDAAKVAVPALKAAVEGAGFDVAA